MDPKRDAKYLRILLDPIRVCATYTPKMGQGRGKGLSLQQFQVVYGQDPFYAWLGLDHPLMYAAHKAAGGMTSVYRQIGIGSERLFRAILRDELGLTAAEATWEYTVTTAGGRRRKLSLDGRIPLQAVRDSTKRARIRDWIDAVADSLDVAPGVAAQLTGAVFEVRQGYKSKDSKRQNADLANAAQAYTQTYLPCVLVMSTQIDTDIAARYHNAKWGLTVGTTLTRAPIHSTYSFMSEVIGYDLAGFFDRNSPTLRSTVEDVLTNLLSAEQ